MSRTIIGLVIACALCMPMAAHSQIINGGFETGNLSGWTLLGQGLARTSSFGITPTVGTYQGYIDTTGNGTVLPGPIVAALGLDSADIMGMAIGGAPTRGSTIYQDITVNSGDLLSFDWNFVTDELTETAVYNDYAFLTISETASLSTTSTAYFLASRNASTYNTTSPPAGFDGQTSWTTGTHTFTSAGTYRVGFVTFNVGDTGVNSALLLDVVLVVPEPATMAIPITAALLFARRRKRD